MAAKTGAFALAAGMVPGIARAEIYPSRRIRMIVGFQPGGLIDTGARILAAGLSETLGASVIVENRSGAGGFVATQYVAGQVPADGYTLLVADATPIIASPQVMGRQDFDPVKDLAPINMIAEAPLAFAINPHLPVHNMKDLVALAHKRQVSVSVSAIGGSSHLLVEAVKEATGGNFLVVPYQGTGPAITDVVAGRVDVNVSDVGSFLPLVNVGKLAIAGVASDKRLDFLPNVPTIQETVPGVAMSIWLGVFAPPHTPKPIIDTLDTAMLKVAARDDIRAKFATLHDVISCKPNTEAFAEFYTAECQRYSKLIEDAHIVIKG